jgi:hypothetical protein
MFSIFANIACSDTYLRPRCSIRLTRTLSPACSTTSTSPSISTSFVRFWGFGWSRTSIWMVIHLSQRFGWRALVGVSFIPGFIELRPVQSVLNGGDIYTNLDPAIARLLPWLDNVRDVERLTNAMTHADYLVITRVHH